MHRRMALHVILAALTSAVVLAADSAAVGTWQLVSDSPGGEQYTWTLVIKDENGKLSGTLSGGPGQYPVLEPKLEGEVFTCKVTIDEQTYAIQARIADNKFDGTWKGPGSQGTIKGKKQS